MKDIHVVILAGGKGTRLYPYTAIFPKPLVPIADMPILEIVVRQLKYYGFEKITFAVNHLSELIRSFFGDGKKFGIDLQYCMEDEPLGTAGCLGLIDNLSENFLVMNGDLLTTFNYASFAKHHLQNKADATIGIYPRNVDIDFGVLEVDYEDRLKEYKEKPSFSFLVSMGINMFNRSALNYIEKNKYLDIPTLMTNLKKSGKNVLTYQSDCEWLDIGRADDYAKADEKFKKLDRVISLNDES